MKSLNSKATMTIQKLYDAMSDPKYRQDEDGNYGKIANSPALMPVVVEKVGNLTGYGEIISIAHYGKQNGDLMADPEMTFVIVDGKYYPISFKNDYVGLYQEVFDYNEEGEPEAIDIQLQSNLTDFANEWMMSIQEQQRL